MKKIIYLLLIILICACSTKKITTEKRQIYHLDSLVKERKDSLAINDFRQSTSQYSLDLKQYQLSPPDTTGRQYIQLITIVKADQMVDQSSVKEESKYSFEVTEQISEENIYEETAHRETNPVRKWSIYVLLILILIFILTYYLRRQQSRIP